MPDEPSNTSAEGRPALFSLMILTMRSSLVWREASTLMPYLASKARREHVHRVDHARRVVGELALLLGRLDQRGVLRQRRDRKSCDERRGETNVAAFSSLMSPPRAGALWHRLHGSGRAFSDEKFGFTARADAARSSLHGGDFAARMPMRSAREGLDGNCWAVLSLWRTRSSPGLAAVIRRR